MPESKFETRCHRTVLACAFCLLLIPGSEPAQGAEDEFAGKRIVHLLDEPRHRTVHRDGELYLLDVQINPGDVSLPHVHDSAILLTYISSRNGPGNGRVSANTDYASEPYTHEVANAGPGLLRILALTSLGEGVDNFDAARPAGLEQDPELANRWFRSWRISLQPGETTAVFSHAYPAVIIQAGDGRVHVRRVDNITTELDAMGDWDWRAAGSDYALVNAGEVAVDIVINEALR